MSKKMYFISGLPRSGSTLLAAILRQNPHFHAAMSSPLAGLFSSLLESMSSRNEGSVLINEQQRKDVLKGVFDSFYASQEEAVIFDTNRQWCAKLPALKQLYPDAKIICCVRNVAWVMNSFEKSFRKNSLQNNKMFNNAVESNTVYSRLDTLGQRDRVVGFAWSALKEAFYSDHSSSLLLVDYDLLVQQPEKTLSLIYQFIDEPYFQHDFNYISYSETAFDQNLGIPGLHNVEGPVRYQTHQSVLPPDLFEKYNHMEFWKDTTGSQANIIRIKDSD